MVAGRLNDWLRQKIYEWLREEISLVAEIYGIPLMVAGKYINDCGDIISIAKVTQRLS